MGRVTSRLLDRANERLVRARIGHRQPRIQRPLLDAYLGGLPEQLFPQPSVLGQLAPLGVPRKPPRSRLKGQVEEVTWRAPNPWLPTDGRHEGDARAAGWVATQLRPPGTGAGTDARGAVIFLHGWLASQWHLSVFRWLVRPLLRAGLEIWIPRLPHHMERTALGAVSGERFISADLVQTAEAVRRAVTEVRLLAAWLRRRRTSRVAIWGVSLGGWIGALAATVETDWEAVALWEPIVEPATTLLQAPMLADIRNRLVTVGFGDPLSIAAFERFSPLHRSLVLSRDRLLVVGARYDEVVTVDQLVALAAAWSIGIWWVPQGHISLTYSWAGRTATIRFLIDALLNKNRSS